jgi:hypothetical protein
MIHTTLSECWAERRLALCSVDPITLTGLALGGLAAGGAAASLAGGGSAPQPTPPPSQPAPQQSPQGTAKSLKPQQPTFIGAAATPPTQSGQKTLLGQ